MIKMSITEKSSNILVFQSLFVKKIKSERPLQNIDSPYSFGIRISLLFAVIGSSLP